MTPIFDIKQLIEFLRDGHADKAIPHLEEITRKLPTHVAAHALLAQAYTIEKRYEQAKIAWQDALFLMPNSPSIQKGFRRVLKALSLQQKLKETLFDPEAIAKQQAPTTKSVLPAPQPSIEEPQEQREEEPTASEANDTPSLLVNPSSHHAIDPEEIKQILPETIPLREPAPADSAPPFNDDEPFPELPVISIPTVSPTVPSDKPSKNTNGRAIPVPPILSSYVENIKEWKEDEELDDLIEELESARIVPKPEHEHVEAPALDTDIEDMVSETLARIYEGQNQLHKAAEMYDKLATQHPAKAEKFRSKAQELRSRTTDESDEMQEASSDES